MTKPREAAPTPGPVEIVSLREHHIAQAAALFARRYQATRRAQPLLPSHHEDPKAIVPKLCNLIAHGAGVAAVRGGRLVGFLLGRLRSQSDRRGSLYIPEWAHGAAGADRVAIYVALYAHLAHRRAATGCGKHTVTVLAHDRAIVQAFFWLGFGLMAVDALRDVSPVNAPPDGASLRRAESRDAAAVLDLVRALRQHLSSAPTFKVYTDEVSQQAIERQLADPKSASWLACCQGRAVGYLHVQPANRSAAYVISDPQTASITSAFVTPDCRGRGIGAALLDRALRWARDAGYVRCAVDFESANPLGQRFWLRHFQAVCYTLTRHMEAPALPEVGSRDGSTQQVGRGEPPASPPRA